MTYPLGGRRLNLPGGPLTSSGRLRQDSEAVQGDLIDLLAKALNDQLRRLPNAKAVADAFAAARADSAPRVRWVR